MVEKELDLLFLNIDERNEILKVLDRDKLVQQKERERLSILKNVVGVAKFKLLAGEWMYGQKKTIDKIHENVSETIRRSFKTLQVTKNDIPSEKEIYLKEDSLQPPDTGYKKAEICTDVPVKEAAKIAKRSDNENLGVFRESKEQTQALNRKSRRPRFHSIPERKPTSLQEILATISSTAPSQRRRLLSTPDGIRNEALKITEEEKSIFDALVIRDNELKNETNSNLLQDDFFTIKHKHEVDMNAVQDMIRKETIATTGTKPPARRKKVDDPRSFYV